MTDLLRLLRLTVPMLALAAGGVSAQVDQPASPSPVDQAERIVPRDPGEPEAFSPTEEEKTNPVRPGLTLGVDWLAGVDRAWGVPEGSGLLPERVFINSVRGIVRRGPHGTLIFVPDPAEPVVLGSAAGSGPVAEPADEPVDQTPDEAVDGTGGEGVEPASVPVETLGIEVVPPLVPTRAVLLLPCSVLDQFDEYVLAGGSEATAIVTGQVFLYGERNYVLPTMIRRALPGTSGVAIEGGTEGSAAASSPSEGAEPASGTEGGVGVSSALAEASGLGDEPDVAALIAELERRPSVVLPPSRADAAGTSPGVEPAGALVAAGQDGRYLTARRGRLSRSKNGTWSFVVDNDDPSGPGPTEFTLLPCRTLEAIESVALRSGDSAAGVLSGRVFSYRGRPYLLPTLFQRERREGVDPLQ